MSNLNIAKYIPQLVPMYNEPHRAYHSLQHIHGLIRMIRQCTYSKMIDKTRFDGPHLCSKGNTDHYLEFITWFHDCYYDPKLGSPGNEKISAEIFEAMATPDIKSDEDSLFISNVVAAINNTAKHLSDDVTPYYEEQIFLDMDLYGFCDAVEFARTNPLVAAEYKDVPTTVYLENRIAFLSKLLEKKRIYYLFADNYEDLARKNITQGIESTRNVLTEIRNLGVL